MNAAATLRRAALAIVALVIQSVDSASVLAQGIDRSRFIATVDSLVAAAIDGGKAAAGMTVGVIKGRDTLLLKPYGYADLEFDVPTPDGAVYEIGSVTKQFTAASILLLQEQGKLSLEDEVTKYLPDYPTQGHRITIRRLLDHTSGIKGYTELPEFGPFMVRNLPRDSLVAMFSQKPFDFAPGEDQVYNNSAFFLLGLIIEKVSGVSYASFIKERLFAPNGMSSSRYCDERMIQKKRTHGYDAGPGGLTVKAYLDQTWPFSAGSLCSTVGDMIAWNRALHGGRVLSPSSYRELTSPARLADGTALRYGMGISLTNIAGHRSIHHSGGINGYVSESAYFPDDDAIIVVLINTAGPVSATTMVGRIAAALLGERVTKPIPLDHPVTDYVGTYRGVGRGAPTVVAVSADSAGELQLAVGQAPPARPTYVGQDRFERGGLQVSFVRDGERVTRLRFDTGGGHYVLSRQP
ncbi:MAG: serine hydrolase domain-containing protein [Gemmatimonadaceae bacterium]